MSFWQNWLSTATNTTYVMEPVGESPQFFLVDMFQFSETIQPSTTLPIQAFAYGEWTDPSTGETVVVDRTLAETIKSNFEANVRGIDIAVDYDHKRDKAKGNQAAGWVRGMEVTDRGMNWLIEFTEDAAKEIREKKWRYFSPTWLKKWMDHENVAIGGGLTNMPVMKGMTPINFSELTLEHVEKEHSDPGTIGPIPGEPRPRELDDERAGTGIGIEGPETEDSMDEAAIRNLFGLDENADVMAHLGKVKTDADKFAAALRQQEQKVAFAEQFPDEYAELLANRKARRENEARRFAESLDNMTDENGRTYILAPASKEAIEAAAYRFAEGDLDNDTLRSTFEAVIKNNLVEMGERGTTVGNPGNDVDAATGDVQQNVIMFGEKVDSYMESNPDADIMTAMAETAKKYPVLAQAYEASLTKVD